MSSRRPTSPSPALRRVRRRALGAVLFGGIFLVGLLTVAEITAPVPGKSLNITAQHYVFSDADAMVTCSINNNDGGTASAHITHQAVCSSSKTGKGIVLGATGTAHACAATSCPGLGNATGVALTKPLTIFDGVFTCHVSPQEVECRNGARYGFKVSQAGEVATT